MKLTKKVDEPWFTLIAMGLKSVEGRLCKGDFSRLIPGDKISWTNDTLGFDRKVETENVKIVRYTSFSKFIRGETIAATLPAYGVDTIKQAAAVYRFYYTEEQEREFGVLALRLK
jgi:ASC-1-like (ASCH) protein